jgi:hypothetical protein
VTTVSLPESTIPADASPSYLRSVIAILVAQRDAARRQRDASGQRVAEMLAKYEPREPNASDLPALGARGVF